MRVVKSTRAYYYYFFNTNTHVQSIKIDLIDPLKCEPRLAVKVVNQMARASAYWILQRTVAGILINQISHFTRSLLDS